MSSPHVPALIAEGLRLLAAGRSIVPVRGKIPVIPKEEGGWDRLKQTALTERELIDLCKAKRPTGIAIIGGAVSGGVEVLDFDYKNGQSLWPEFKRRAGAELLEGIPFQRTGSGNGFQGAYLCPNPGHNQKLAAVDTHNPDRKLRWEYIIETRGEGGYALIPPSVHPDTHREYRYLVGDFVDLPFISQDRRDTLIALARELNEKIEEVHKPRPFIRPTTDMVAQRAEAKVVIHLYNQRLPIDYCLSSAGYAVHGDWAVRPGGKRRTVKIDRHENRSYHNGTSDPMCDGRGTEGYWKRPFDFLMYEKGGDFKEAIAVAAKEVNVTLVSSRSQPHPIPDMPPVPVVPKPSRKSNIIIVTDHHPDLEVCERLGIPAVISPRHILLPEVVAAVEPYSDRILVAAPPDDGFSHALAADLQARLVPLVDNLATIVSEGRVSLIDLVAMIRGAMQPQWRTGLR